MHVLDTSGTSVSSALLCLQINRPLTTQLLWVSCPAAIQKLLQPVPVQLLDLLQAPLELAHPMGQNPAAPAAARGSQPVLQQLPAALAAVRFHLESTAGGTSKDFSVLLTSVWHLAAVLLSAGAGQPALPVSAASVDGLQHQGQDLLGRHHQRQQQQQQQQQQQYLMPAGSADASKALQEMVLQLAAAALQLLKGLVVHDDSCLRLLAAGLGNLQLPGIFQLRSVQHAPAGPSQQQQRRYGRFSFGLQESGQGYRHSSSVPVAGLSVSDAAHATWQWQQWHGPRRWPGSAAAGNPAADWGPLWAAVLGAGSTSRHPAAAAAAAAVAEADSLLDGNNGSSSAAKGASGGASQQLGPLTGTVLGLLEDAGACSRSLLLPAGAVLVALAGRLPVPLRFPLLYTAADTNSLLLQLLQADDCQLKCSGMNTLQELVVCPEALAVLRASLAPDASLQDKGAAGPSRFAVMQHADSEAATAAVGQAEMRTALQPLNRLLPADRIKSSGSNNKEVAAASSSGASLVRGGKPVVGEQQQQQAEPEPDVAGSMGSPTSIVSLSAAQALLQGVLDGVSSGLNEALQQVSSSNSSSSSGNAALVSNYLQNHRGSSGSSSWGPFELQRRSCAVVAMLLHSKQVLLLQLLHDRQFTEGVAVGREGGRAS
jgi:hypothetical protein